MITVTWNEIPFKVRHNLVTHYLPMLEDNSRKDIVQCIVEDYGAIVNLRPQPGTLIELTFPDEQYTWFILKWT